MDFARFGRFWGAPDGKIRVFRSLLRFVKANSFDTTINKPILCGLCAKPVWLLNLENHHKENHAGTDAAATDTANFAEAKQIVDGAASKLEKILLKRQRRQGGKKKKN